MHTFLAIDSLYIQVAHINHIELQGNYQDKDGRSHDAVWICLQGAERSSGSPQEGLVWLDEEAVALRESLQRWLAGQSCHIRLAQPALPLEWLAIDTEFQGWLAEITAVSEQEPLY